MIPSCLKRAVLRLSSYEFIANISCAILAGIFLIPAWGCFRCWQNYLVQGCFRLAMLANLYLCFNKITEFSFCLLKHKRGWQPWNLDWSLCVVNIDAETPDWRWWSYWKMCQYIHKEMHVFDGEEEKVIFFKTKLLFNCLCKLNLVGKVVFMFSVLHNMVLLCS